ncbi:MAG: hypothetical protein AAFY60_12530, partial [Myxococcota bacterium]
CVFDVCKGDAMFVSAAVQGPHRAAVSAAAAHRPLLRVALGVAGGAYFAFVYDRPIDGVSVEAVW